MRHVTEPRALCEAPVTHGYAPAKGFTEEAALTPPACAAGVSPHHPLPAGPWGLVRNLVLGQRQSVVPVRVDLLHSLQTAGRQIGFSQLFTGKMGAQRDERPSPRLAAPRTLQSRSGASPGTCACSLLLTPLSTSRTFARCSQWRKDS